MPKRVPNFETNDTTEMFLRESREKEAFDSVEYVRSQGRYIPANEEYEGGWWWGAVMLFVAVAMAAVLLMPGIWLLYFVKP